MSTLSFLSRVRVWWHAPITRKDRTTGLFVGAFAGFWLGALGRLALGPTPVGSSELLAFAMAGIVSFAVLGYRHPKAATVFLFPFAIFGTS